MRIRIVMDVAVMPESVVSEDLAVSEDAILDAIQIDPTCWVSASNIVLANGEIFSFAERPYLIQPMRSKHKRICVEKAAQLGFSETFILRELHGCIFGIYKQGSIYLFPNADEMRKFSQSRFNTLIQANKATIGKYVKSGGRGGTDTANLKRVGRANLFLDGATLTQSIGDNVQQQESAALRGKAADSLNLDEGDLMNPDILTLAGPRLKNSDIARITVLSNPSIPNWGISKLFNQSNQNQWFRKCLHCNHWNCPDEVFPEYISIDDSGKGYCACQKCGKSLGLGIYLPGSPEHSCEWRPLKPENKEWEGYHISTLNHPKTDPYKVKTDFEEAKREGGVKLQNFYKFELGLPYIDSEDQLTPPTVYDCCGQDVMALTHTGPCAMGLDVGLTKHALIGFRTEREKWEIIRAARIPSFADALVFVRKYGVKSAVVDIRPYEDAARQFQKDAVKLGCKVYLCEYSQNPMEEAFWDNNRKVVKTYRTGILDVSHRLIAEKKIKLPRRCPEIDEFVKQVCSMAKVLGENKRTHTPIYEYISTNKDDHYRHVLGYFYLAASGNKISMVKSKYAISSEPQFVVNDNSRYI